jgi:type VI secretion system protein ImpH
MRLADLEHLLPEGEAFRRLKTWVMNYVGDEFFWDAQLVLQAAEVPPIQLGQASRLGWTSWLRTGPFTRDADDVILQP